MSGRTAALLLALLLVALGAALRLAPGHGTWVIDPDASAYVGLARALADGDGYTFAGVPHAKFPPGFPAYLAVAVTATGDPECYGTMRDLVSLAGLVAVLLSFFVGRRLLRLSPGGALLVAAAAGTSVFLFQYSVAFLRSETLFTAWFLGALLLGEWWRRRGGALPAAACGGALAVAALVRTAGICALPALALARLVRTEPFRIDLSRAALLEVVLFGVVAAAGPGGFALRNATIDEARSSGYAGELMQAYALDHTKDVDRHMPRIDAGGWRDRLTQNVAVLALSLGKFVVNDNAGANLAVHPRTGALRPSGAALLALLLLGWVLAWRRTSPVVGFVVPAYVALYLIWPFNQQQRFYLPLQPLLLALLAFGVEPFLRLAVSVATRPAGRILLAAVALVGTIGLGLGRSEDAALLGRWSVKYAALVFVAAGMTVALITLAAVAGRRRADAESWRTRATAAGLGALLLLWVATLGLFLRGLAAEHREFLALRAAAPVAPEFARLKGHPQLFDMLSVLTERAGPDDLVMSDIPKMIHVAAGLRTTPFVYSSRDLTVDLDAGGAPARFVYFSREIPTACAAYDAFRAAEADRIEVLYQATVGEGKDAVVIELLEILPE